MYNDADSIHIPFQIGSLVIGNEQHEFEIYFQNLKKKTEGTHEHKVEPITIIDWFFKSSIRNDPIVK